MSSLLTCLPTLRCSCLEWVFPNLLCARELERKTGLEVFVDMSVSETLYHLIFVGATQPGGGQGRDGLIGEASVLQKRLKVPDKRFWHIKIKVPDGGVLISQVVRVFCQKVMAWWR